MARSKRKAQFPLTENLESCDLVQSRKKKRGTFQEDFLNGLKAAGLVPSIEVKQGDGYTLTRIDPFDNNQHNNTFSNNPHMIVCPDKE